MRAPAVVAEVLRSPETEPRPAPKPEPRVELSDLRFRALMTEEGWASLPLAIRRRFSKRLAGGQTIATSHPRGVRLHVGPPRVAPPPPTPTTTTPAPTTTTPTPTTPAPTTPPPATSITVDPTHPGAAINPAIFGSDYLAPFGGMGISGIGR